MFSQLRRLRDVTGSDAWHHLPRPCRLERIVRRSRRARGEIVARQAHHVRRSSSAVSRLMCTGEHRLRPEQAAELGRPERRNPAGRTASGEAPCRSRRSAAQRSGSESTNRRARPWPGKASLGVEIRPKWQPSFQSRSCSAFEALPESSSLAPALEMAAKLLETPQWVNVWVACAVTVPTLCKARERDVAPIRGFRIH